jgi:hypothetical protein
MLIAIVVACEVGFWLLLAAGLAVRYLLGKRRLGAALLVAVPVVDVVLLTATVVDLAGGATATFGHGLAAAYIGFSIAFGHRVVRWADERFAHRFAGGPPPPPPLAGWRRARAEWRDLARALLAWTISCTLLVGAIAFVDEPARTEALEGWIAQLTVVVGVWSLWPITYTVIEAGKALGRRGWRLVRSGRAR